MITPKNSFKYKKGKILKYEVIGKGKKTILFSEGLGGLLLTSKPFLDELAKNYKIIIYNYPGLNGSTGPVKNAYQIRDIVIKLLEHLKIKEIYLIGHSSGTIISLAISEKIKPKKIILLNPVIPNIKNGLTQVYRVIKALIKAKFDEKTFLNNINHYSTTKKTPKKVIYHIRDKFIEEGTIKTMFFGALLGGYNFKNKNLQNTLVLRGNLDKMQTLKEQQKYFKNIIEYKHQAHFLHIEEEQKAIKQIHSFLD